MSSCFSLCSLLRWPTLGERTSPNLLKPAPAPLRSKLYCLLFQSTVPPEHSSSRYHLSDFMSFYFFCKFNYLPLDSSKFSSFLVLLFLFILYEKCVTPISFALDAWDVGLMFLLSRGVCVSLSALRRLCLPCLSRVLLLNS